MADFAAMISTGKRTLLIDSINTFDISESNEITDHPMVNGQYIADHVIIKPCTINISGTLSMNGSTNVPNLAALQKLYEDIKDNAELCSVAKVKNSTNEFRFLKRQNMVLTGIVWSERINSLGFSFTFSQALTSAVLVRTSAIQSKYPDPLEPTTSSFAGTIVSEEELFQRIMNILYETKIVDAEFLKAIALDRAEVSAGAAALVGTAAIGSYLAGSGAAATLGAGAAGLSATGVGLVVVGAALAIAGTYLVIDGITSLVKDSLEYAKIRFKKFEKKDDWEEQQAEKNRFNNMMNQIYAKISNIKNEIACYTLTSTEQQEVLMNIGGEYYIFAITRDNSYGTWKCKIEDMQNVIQGSKTITAQKSYESCNKGNQFATVKGGYNIFFVGPDSKNLSTMMIVVSTMDATDFSDKITESIRKALYYNESDAVEEE